MGSDYLDAPYVDIDEWRDIPVLHRYIHGGFEGTSARFSFYLPPQELYQGRFFQHITPVPDSENLAPCGRGEENKLGFALASGGYFVETNGGGNAAGDDPTIAGYRVNAAAAEYSREIAANMYGSHRAYGYAYGGSGGAYRTIGGFENTEGVWDGVVPYVPGSPMAIPNVFTVRLHAMRILKDRFAGIVDAVDVGGSGDIYAGLNEEEREALEEVTRMGFPPRSWFGYRTMGQHAFPVLFQGVIQADPSYFSDFWSVPGHLGFRPTASLSRARIQHPTTIKNPVTADQARNLGMEVQTMPGTARGAVDTAFELLGTGAGCSAPVGFQLSNTPSGDIEGARLLIRSGAAAGHSLLLRDRVGDVITTGPADAQVLADIRPGDKVEIDNSDFLAVQTYHRHQVPASDFPVWDQFRDREGQPTYPQRPLLLGPLFSQFATGSVQTGKFQGKMIVVAALLDREAYPWQADWYSAQVEAASGSNYGDQFRLWFADNALHGDQTEQEDPGRTVSYIGLLHQALRDLSAWVETGTAPPASTSYKVMDGQVVVPPTARERRGIQPVITVTANGAARAEIEAGEPVELIAIIEVPPRGGYIVSAAWDLDGTGKNSVVPELKHVDIGGDKVTLSITHRFAQPGTYFPVLRATAQRQGDAGTPYAQIQNLGRARVVVN